ncbi:MAG: twin-arginine translocase TatA/TatE family subunit [Henriciella sp.]
MTPGIVSGALAAYLPLNQDRRFDMGAVGPLQLVLIAVVALLLFGGRGRISSIMGDMAKGIRSFRTGLRDDEAGKKAVSDDDMVNITPETEKSKTTD